MELDPKWDFVKGDLQRRDLWSPILSAHQIPHSLPGTILHDSFRHFLLRERNHDSVDSKVSNVYFSWKPPCLGNHLLDGHFVQWLITQNFANNGSPGNLRIIVTFIMEIYRSSFQIC